MVADHFNSVKKKKKISVTYFDIGWIFHRFFTIYLLSTSFCLWFFRVIKHFKKKLNYLRKNLYYWIPNVGNIALFIGINFKIWVKYTCLYISYALKSMLSARNKKLSKELSEKLFFITKFTWIWLFNTYYFSHSNERLIFPNYVAFYN